MRSGPSGLRASREPRRSFAMYTLRFDSHTRTYPLPEHTSTMSSSPVTYARDNQQRFLGELKDLLRIPSVRALPDHKEHGRRAAQVVADEMKRIGMEHVEVIPTSGHPLVYGDWLHAAGK